MSSPKLTPGQANIKQAVLDELLKVLLQQNSLTTMMLTSRQIVKIFRIHPCFLCALRKEGIIPAVKVKRSYYYNPLDLLDLFTLDERLN